jgi:arabinose-5-phosphate isomerase
MSILEMIRKSLLQEASALEQLKEDINEEYEKAIALMLACEGKIIVTGIGKSGHIGRKIAASLSSTGTPAFFVHSAEGLHGDSGMIEERDVVVLLSNSGETTEVLNVLEIVKDIGSRRIAITQNTHSTLAKNCNATLAYRFENETDHLGLAPTTSALLQLAIGDALVSTLCELKKFDEKEFHKYHPGGSLGQQLSDRD